LEKKVLQFPLTKSFVSPCLRKKSKASAKLRKANLDGKFISKEITSSQKVLEKISFDFMIFYVIAKILNGVKLPES
jgi:hypothetical protein